MKNPDLSKNAVNSVMLKALDRPNDKSSPKDHYYLQKRPLVPIEKQLRYNYLLLFFVIISFLIYFICDIMHIFLTYLDPGKLTFLGTLRPF